MTVDRTLIEHAHPRASAEARGTLDSAAGGCGDRLIRFGLRAPCSAFAGPEAAG